MTPVVFASTGSGCAGGGVGANVGGTAPGAFPLADGVAGGGAEGVGRGGGEKKTLLSEEDEAAMAAQSMREQDELRQRLLGRPSGSGLG